MVDWSPRESSNDSETGCFHSIPRNKSFILFKWQIIFSTVLDRLSVSRWVISMYIINLFSGFSFFKEVNGLQCLQLSVTDLAGRECKWTGLQATCQEPSPESGNCCYSAENFVTLRAIPWNRWLKCVVSLHEERLEQGESLWVFDMVYHSLESHFQCQIPPLAPYVFST